MEMFMGSSSGEFSTMGKSMTEQCRLEIKGPRAVNSFFQRRNNDSI